MSVETSKATEVQGINTAAFFFFEFILIFSVVNGPDLIASTYFNFMLLQH